MANNSMRGFGFGQLVPTGGYRRYNGYGGVYDTDTPGQAALNQFNANLITADNVRNSLLNQDAYDSMQNIGVARNYIQPLLNNRLQALQNGMTPEDFYLSQRQTMLNDPVYQGLPSEAKNLVVSELTKSALMQAGIEQQNGNYAGARKIASAFAGVPDIAATQGDLGYQVNPVTGQKEPGIYQDNVSAAIRTGDPQAIVNAITTQYPHLGLSYDAASGMVNIQGNKIPLTSVMVNYDPRVGAPSLYAPLVNAAYSQRANAAPPLQPLMPLAAQQAPTAPPLSPLQPAPYTLPNGMPLGASTNQRQSFTPLTNQLNTPYNSMQPTPSGNIPYNKPNFNNVMNYRGANPVVSGQVPNNLLPPLANPPPGNDLLDPNATNNAASPKDDTIPSFSVEPDPENDTALAQSFSNPNVAADFVKRNPANVGIAKIKIASLISDLMAAQRSNAITPQQRSLLSSLLMAQQNLNLATR